MPSVFRHPMLVVNALHNRAEFMLGFNEAFGDGRTYDNDPTSPKSLAYDTGRDLRRWGRA